MAAIFFFFFGGTQDTIRTRPRTILLAMLTMKNQIDGLAVFPPAFFHGYGALLCGPLGR